MLHPASGLPLTRAGQLTRPQLATRSAGLDRPFVVLAMSAMCGIALSLNGLSAMSAPGMGLMLAGAALALVLWQSGRPVTARIAILFLAGLALGQMRTDWRMDDRSAVPVIDTRDAAIPVTGWLRAIERSGQGRTRLLIEVPVDVETGAPAHRIRVLADPGALVPGEWLTLDAVLAPPRPAARPGGYDFSYYAFFDRLAATGYAIRPARPAPDPAQAQGGLGQALERALAGLRWHIAERIRDRAPGRTGALAAALLTGDRSGLDRADVDALRASGLGHLLAISGLHMALLAGGVFYAVRAALALWPRWARRHDPAVPAAIIALLAALVYLGLSGAAIPTQRAFIMTAAALGAVILRRRAISFHTLAVALLIILMLTPEAVLSPGFQMSFAAVAALVAVARHWQDQREPAGAIDPFRTVRVFLGGLSTTSLVAGAATAGFGAWHFHRIASFGLIGNLVVMPVFTLLVMPAGIVTLLLLPFGLEAWPLAFMTFWLGVVLDVASWVAAQPGALGAVPSAPGHVLAIYTVGFCSLVLGRARVQVAGVGVMLLALAVWGGLDRPDLFISRGGTVLVRADDGPGWQASTTRRDRFAARVFLEAEAERVPLQAWTAACDSLGCSRGIGPGRAQTQRQGQEQAPAPAQARVVVLAGFDQWREDCRRARIIITPLPVPPHLVRSCAAEVFDPARLEREGSVLVHLADTGHLRLRTARPASAAHPWHNRPVLLMGRPG